MTLYAFDAIDDAIDATRAFLWPFDLGRWTRLALVMLFIGGVGGFNPASFTSSTPPGGGGEIPADAGTFPDLGPEIWALIAVVVAVVVFIALLFLLVGSIVEFVFVESLRRETVTIRRYFRERWRQGVRLFGFRLVLGLLTVGVFVGLGLLVLWPVLSGAGEFSLGLLLLAIPAFVVVAIASGLIDGFTTVFVVPVMIAEDCGVLSGWSRFWATMTGQWKQYAAYVVMGFVLGIAAGLVAFIVTILAAIVVAIPLAIVGVIGWVLFQSSPIVGGVVIGIAVLLFVLAMIVVSLFVSVPIQTFLRYYALFVLGDTNEAFDLIPKRRRAVRE